MRHRAEAFPASLIEAKCLRWTACAAAPNSPEDGAELNPDLRVLPGKPTPLFSLPNA
jgi:hypothetical protein